MLFTQIIHKNKWTHKNKFLKISQYLEKYSSTVQPLTYSSWHQENRQKELLIGGGEEVGDGRAKGSSAIGDKQAAISLMPDRWWHRFRFLAGFNPVYPLEWLLQPPRTILRSGPVPPKLPSASSGEENPPAFPVSQSSDSSGASSFLVSLHPILALLSYTRYVEPVLSHLLPDTLGLK